MANEEQLQIISEDGVDRWNAWRLQNPDVHTDLGEADLKGKFLQNANFHNTNLRKAVLCGADLTSANLLNANLEGADFTTATLTGANLTGANLKDAVLDQAKLNNANLEGANLEGVNLHKTVFSGANLVNANLRGANLALTVFDGAKFTDGTLGMGGLNLGQRASMTLVDVEPQPEDASEEPDPQTPDHAATLTVGFARSIVEPAHWVLQNLTTPNDLSEEHRELFVELRRIVEELKQELTDLKEENRRLPDESEALKKIKEGLPLWKKAWEVFIIGAAGGVGGAIVSGASFQAGFVAGVLYNTFSPDVSGICV